MARDQRRLAAIVSADVVGYSLLMGRDDSATLAGLKAHRRELIDPKIAEYCGRIVKTTGDGLLLEFPSVVDAVRCAVDVQRGMAERNAGLPLEQRIEFRIGINVGDIIIDDDDIFGDGVNVAARLQTLADPGGICVSKVVRDQVLDKLSFAFEDLGAQEVKNIARSVEVYRVDLGSEALQTSHRGRGRWRQLTRGLRRWVTVGLLVLGVAGIAAWMLPRFWKTAGSAPTAPHFSVAILPFTVVGGGPADEKFAEALTNDLTNELTMGVNTMGSVVSHSLAATYRGKAIDVRAVGRELNIRYLVEGEVRRVGERIVVSAQFINASNASQVWSNSLELDSAQPMQSSGGLVTLLGRQLRMALSDDEYRRASSASLPPGASAMDIALRAHAIYLQDNSDNYADLHKAMLEARKEFARALRLDPNLVFAMVTLADTLDDELADGRGDHDRLVRELDEVTNRAVAADRNSASAWGMRAKALIWQRRWQAAREAATRMSTLVPNSPWPFVRHGTIMLYTGQPADAVVWFGKALAMDPGSLNEQLQRQALAERCEAYIALGRYEEAITDCEKSEALNDYWDKHLYLAAAYAQKGDTAKAEAEKILLLKDHPGLTIADLRAMRQSNEPAYLDQTETHLYAGLRKAGIPEN